MLGELTNGNYFIYQFSDGGCGMVDVDGGINYDMRILAHVEEVTL